MKPAYNRSKIMRNAWYMFRVKMVKNFAEALRKAWKNEKLANIRAMIEGARSPLPSRHLIIYPPGTTRHSRLVVWPTTAMQAGITATDAKRVKHCFTANCL